MDHYLYLAVAQFQGTADEIAALERTLGAHGRVARLLETAWLLAVDADVADEKDLHAGSLLEELFEEMGEDLRMTLVSVDNIATLNVIESGEALLDEIVPEYEEGPEQFDA